MEDKIEKGRKTWSISLLLLLSFRSFFIFLSSLSLSLSLFFLYFSLILHPFLLFRFPLNRNENGRRRIPPFFLHLFFSVSLPFFSAFSHLSFVPLPHSGIFVFSLDRNETSIFFSFLVYTSLYPRLFFPPPLPFLKEGRKAPSVTFSLPLFLFLSIFSDPHFLSLPTLATKPTEEICTLFTFSCYVSTSFFFSLSPYSFFLFILSLLPFDRLFFPEYTARWS